METSTIIGIVLIIVTALVAAIAFLALALRMTDQERDAFSFLKKNNKVRKINHDKVWRKSTNGIWTAPAQKKINKLSPD